jgi:D-glutamate cyclase
MTAGRDPHRLVDRVEALIQEDVGRNMTALFAAARGGLWSAASALARSRPGSIGPIGLITGFYVPQGSPPGAETDGPVGAALLARGFAEIGALCRLATDEPCRGACVAALAAAGAAAVPVDSVPIGAPLAGLVETWRQSGIASAISIERCGKSADGAPRNMRGLDISAYTAPLDELFAAGPWQTIAIGDGGNEIGMGALPRSLIARHVAAGAAIACVTPARHLIVAGVSNWGAYGLLGALALLREDWRLKLAACLDEALDRRILETMIAEGPAVDGVSRARTATVDNLPLAVHHEKLRQIRALIAGPDEI